MNTTLLLEKNQKEEKYKSNQAKEKLIKNLLYSDPFKDLVTAKGFGQSKHDGTIMSEYHTQPLCLNIAHHHPILGTRMSACYKRRRKKLSRTQYASLRTCTLFLFSAGDYQLFLCTHTAEGGWVGAL